jgi:large subunit ribosomal protein L11
MAKKKVLKIIKLQIEAGKANPGPPIGPALGAAGLNIMTFCKDFNARTQKMTGDILPVVIEVYQDRTFSFITKQPPVSRLILQECKLEKGSKIPNREKAGKINREQIKRIVERKKPDMGARTDAAMERMIEGTAKSMGIEVEG